MRGKTTAASRRHGFHPLSSAPKKKTSVNFVELSPSTSSGVRSSSSSSSSKGRAETAPDCFVMREERGASCLGDASIDRVVEGRSIGRSWRRRRRWLLLLLFAGATAGAAARCAAATERDARAPDIAERAVERESASVPVERGCANRGAIERERICFSASAASFSNGKKNESKEKKTSSYKKKEETKRKNISTRRARARRPSSR